MKNLKYFLAIVAIFAVAALAFYGCEEGLQKEAEITKEPGVIVPGIPGVEPPDVTTPPVAKPGDMDGDGILDADDPDMDGDGIPNDQDPDADGDGVLDTVDNAPGNPNPDQTDTDGDGTGDVVDNDVDGDGTPNTSDTDADADGYAKIPEGPDCDDLNPAVHPGAEDKPDLPNMLDSNCDGIDGDKNRAVWVSATEGDDQNEGSISFPFKTISAAAKYIEDNNIDKDIFVVGGTTWQYFYKESFYLKKCEDIYGGYSKNVGAAQVPAVRVRSNITTYLESANDVPLTIHSENCPNNETISVVQGLTIMSGNGNPAIYVNSSNGHIEYNNIYAHADYSNATQAIGVKISSVLENKKVVVKNNTIRVYATKQFNSFGSVGVYADATGKIAIHVLENKIEVRNSKSFARGVFAEQLPKGGVTIAGNDVTVGFTAGSTLDVTAEDAVSSAGFVLIKPEYVDIHDNVIKVIDGDVVRGIRVYLPARPSKIYNNMFVIGDSDQQEGTGIDLAHYNGIVTNNTIWLNAYNPVLANACGIRLANSWDKALIANNLIDVNFDLLKKDETVGICKIHDEPAGSMMNNFFGGDLGAYYYVLLGDYKYKIIADINEDFGEFIKGNVEGLSPYKNYIDEAKKGQLHINYDIWVNDGYTGANKGLKSANLPNGTLFDLEKMYKMDIDGQVRGEKWDIGADEWQFGQ